MKWATQKTRKTENSLNWFRFRQITSKKKNWKTRFFSWKLTWVSAKNIFFETKPIVPLTWGFQLAIGHQNRLSPGWPQNETRENRGCTLQQAYFRFSRSKINKFEDRLRCSGRKSWNFNAEYQNIAFFLIQAKIAKIGPNSQKKKSFCWKSWKNIFHIFCAL